MLFQLLTLSQTANFRIFQTKRVCRITISNCIGNGREFLKRSENTEGKGEIAHYKQFLLFPQGCQESCTTDT